MRIFIKLGLFLCLVVAMAFLSGMLLRSLNKELHFGEEYVGLTETELVDKFGVPDVKKNLKFNDLKDDFHYLFEDLKNECNQNSQVVYVLYDNLIFNYEFWLFQNSFGKNVVVLVK